jgi:hypothetical protein
MPFRNITSKKTQSVKEQLLQNPIVNFHRKENYLSEMLLRVLLVIELDDPSFHLHLCNVMFSASLDLILMKFI